MTSPKMIFTALAATLIMSAATAIAAAPAPTPTSVVRAILDKVMTIQTDPALQGTAHRDDRQKGIRSVIAANFNFDEMASESLGKYWKTLSAAQQKTFRTIFKDIFQDSYTRLVLDFLEREQVKYLEEAKEGGKVRVDTSIVRAHDEIRVDYLLGKTGNGYLVEDVTIDGVSIIDNYRHSFDRVIQQKGYDALMAAMKRQQEAIR